MKSKTIVLLALIPVVPIVSILLWVIMLVTLVTVSTALDLDDPIEVKEEYKQEVWGWYEFPDGWKWVKVPIADPPIVVYDPNARRLFDEQQDELNDQHLQRMYDSRYRRSKLKKEQ